MPSPERIIPITFKNAAHNVTDSGRENNNNTFGARELALLKADVAVMPRLDFVTTKSNLILSSVLFSASLLRLTLAACCSHTDG